MRSSRYYALDRELLRLWNETAVNDLEDRLDVEEPGRIVVETHAELVTSEQKHSGPQHCFGAYDPFPADACAACTPETVSYLSRGSDPLRVRMGYHFASSLCTQLTRPESTRRASRHASARTVCATGGVAGEVFFGVAPLGVPALVSLPPTSFISRLVGVTGTPQHRSPSHEIRTLPELPRTFWARLPKRVRMGYNFASFCAQLTRLQVCEAGLWAYSGYVHP